jgi:23S rRNA (uracil1939-C5)-methyltransferase
MTTVELRPSAVAAGGDAVARDEGGRVVFVTGALPGEAVVVEITEERKRFARGHVVEVLEPSPDRVEPACRHVARGCGGCSWQHVDVDAQRRLKVGIVADTLRKLGGVADPTVEAGPVLPATGHRTTIRVAVIDGRAGFRRHHSHEIVDVDECIVAHPLLDELLREGRFGAAVEVTLRCGANTGERLVVVTPSAAGVEVPAGVVVVGDDELGTGHRAWFHEEVAGHRFRISARSFFQTRPDGAAALVDAVRAASEGAPDGRMLDAYGGVGLFAATVAGDRPVTLVEWSSSSVADARVNVPHAKVLRMDLAKWHASPAALVVADPARTGLGAAAVKALAGTGAGHLVLVSCDPASLGRDAALLAAEGFEHDRTTLVDLFPHTAHVEAVTRFIREPVQLRRTGR